jgi:hypothetical protein
MSSQSSKLLAGSALVVCAALTMLAGCGKSQIPQQTFATPEEAFAALVAAAEKYDVPALEKILGSDGVDLVVTGDRVLDENQSKEFAAQARIKTQIVRDPLQPEFATAVIGPEDWPSPIPLIEAGGMWRFDTQAGREEIIDRRVGENELNAIAICRGYVEAQYDYASEKRGGARVNQYAQQVLSTPGKQDGLAWQAADGTWEGPVGEGVGKAIAVGYSADRKNKPFLGYYFKVLKGQGPAAPMGEMDYVVNGSMIGGFALAAAPSEYAVNGVKTFIVSNTGIVYQKDLGEDTLEDFAAMDRYNPDSTWTPVETPEETAAPADTAAD